MSFFANSPLRAIVVLVLLAVVQSGCHKKRVPVALPVQPAPASEPKEEPAEPTELPTPPTLPPANTAAPAIPGQTPTVKEESKYQKNRPPEQTTSAPRRTRSAPPATAPQPVAPSTPPASESPRLGDILSPDQQRQFNSAIDQSLSHAQTSLGSLSNRQLSTEQLATVEQVKNFIRQALETRKTDLSAARSLAERAEVLANDLVASLH